MNFLILAAGSRNKIVQYFRRTFDETGLIVATDSSELAPAIYDADKFYIVPLITENNYIDTILKICKDEKISGALSLIDPELSLLAYNEDRFRDAGVMIIGSGYDLCEMSFDKMRMFRWLKEHDYNCALSWDDLDEFLEAEKNGCIKYPVFVKPRTGSASIGIQEIQDEETLRAIFNNRKDLMIQEYLVGQEIGADVYIDMISGEVVSVFTKKKIKMRAGETDKSVSFKNDRLFDYIERFAKEAGYRGQIDIDLFEINGEYYVSEVNPRFGGGYPHAYECGCDHMKLILNNLNGIANKTDIGNYEEGIYMMKYSDLKMIRDHQGTV